MLFDHEHSTLMAAMPSSKSYRAHFMAITSLKDSCVKQLLRMLTAHLFEKLINIKFKQYMHIHILGRHKHIHNCTES